LATLFGEAKGAGLGCGRIELLDRTGEAEKEFLAILKRLCQSGFVVKTDLGLYVLGRDLSAVTLADIVRLLDLGLASGGDDAHAEPLMESIASRLNDVARAEEAALDMPLNMILEAVWKESRPRRLEKGPRRQSVDVLS
jgi:DNA-binding IscR family transcriptional regulator